MMREGREGGNTDLGVEDTPEECFPYSIPGRSRVADYGLQELTRVGSRSHKRKYESVP